MYQPRKNGNPSRLLCQSIKLETKQDYESINKYMADHAGGRRSVVNPGTKLWRPHGEVTQFWRPRSGFGASFL